MLTLPEGPDVPGGRTLATEPAWVIRDAPKIADHVVYGAPSPALRFPAQLSGLPSNWRVGSVYYLVEAGRIGVNSFALTTGHPSLGADGGMEFQLNLPYFSFWPGAVGNKGRVCGMKPNKTINGYRVYLDFAGAPRDPYHRNVSPQEQDLCADSADGLAFTITQQGTHPPFSVATMFGSHLRLLGSNPVGWTTKPIQ